jgi:penicillin-binding protein 2
MTELKNTERELYLFRLRLIFLGIFVLACFSALVTRFVWLQIVKHDDYVLLADENRIDVVPVVPNRGLIWTEMASFSPEIIQPIRWRLLLPRSIRTWMC